MNAWIIPIELVFFIVTMTTVEWLMKKQNNTTLKHYCFFALFSLIAIGSWGCWTYFGGSLFVHSMLSTRINERLGNPSTEKNDHSDIPKEQENSDSASRNLERSALIAEVGQVGDSYGGINALLTAFAGAIVFWAGYLQLEQLKQARFDASEAKQRYKEEVLSRRSQEFESLFFQVLTLTREITERIEFVHDRTYRKAGGAENKSPIISNQRNDTVKVGAAALDAFAARIANMSPKVDDAVEQMKILVENYMRKVYNVAPSKLGPYFRMLYQTFKLIADSNLDEHARIRYSNIARAQIGEGAVLLLALNGWGAYGAKFVPLIERFGLLEHMHPVYRLKFKNVLRTHYRERAFLGKEERLLPENEWIPHPLREPFYKILLDPPTPSLASG